MAGFGILTTSTLKPFQQMGQVVLRVDVIADTGFESLLKASLNLLVTCITNGTPIPIAIPVKIAQL